MNIKDLTFDHCIVSSTPEEWATVQNIFLMNGYESKYVSNLPEGDTFINHPVTLNCTDKGCMNTSEYIFQNDENKETLSAAEFINANVPPETRVTGFNINAQTHKSPQIQNIPVFGETKNKALEEYNKGFDEARKAYVATGRRPILTEWYSESGPKFEMVATPYHRGHYDRTDLEQLQDEIEMAVRKDVNENSHLFDQPFQIGNALASIEFKHLRELLSARFPLMNSVPSADTENKNEPSAHSSNVL